MAEPKIVFDDGAVYERFMRRWSNAVGKVFLDWLAPRKMRSGSISAENAIKARVPQ